LHVENFKSLLDITIEPDPILSVLIGRNDVGKSNILDALVFVSEAISGSIDRDAVANRGGPVAVLFAGKSDRPIVIELEMHMDDKEMADLHAALVSSMSFEDFSKLWQPRWIYQVRIGWQGGTFSLISEQIWTWIKEKQIEYARSSWQGQGTPGLMHYHEAIDNIASGINDEVWTLRRDGGQTPPRSLLQSADYQVRPEWYPLKQIGNYLTGLLHLNPVRAGPETDKLIGRYRLAGDARDLVQVLQSLASSRRRTFDAILADAIALIPELLEIRASPVEGTDQTYLSVTKRDWPQFELLWRNIAAGTKEVVYLLTFLHVAPSGSLLLIEEPESHLHAQAIQKLYEILQERAEVQNKQIIVTTHSLTLIDVVPFERVIFVKRENGATRTLSIKSYAEVELLFNAAQIHKSSILSAPSLLVILLVEGRDDVKIWQQFLTREGTDIVSLPLKIVPGLKQGGREGVVAAASFLNRLGPPLSFYAVLDKDGEKSLVAKLREEGVPQENYHFLSRGEIEDYLLEPSAISALVNKKQAEVEEVLGTIGGHGKERLEAVLTKLGISKVSSEVKELIVLHLSQIPLEIHTIAKELTSRAAGIKHDESSKR
jgi:predicted ATPase